MKIHSNHETANQNHTGQKRTLNFNIYNFNFTLILMCSKATGNSRTIEHKCDAIYLCLYI